MTVEHDDPRVIVAVEDYLTALESGRRVDPSAFLRLHADIAVPLAECLAALRLIERTVPLLLRLPIPGGEAEHDVA